MSGRDDMIFRMAPELREIAEDLKATQAIMWRLYHVDLDRGGCVYETTCEHSDDAAKCRKVDEPWRSILADCGLEWDWLIEVYGSHAEDKSREWMQILIYHELRHIGILGKIVKHDIEDFSDILAEFGIEWSADKGELPDITKLEPEY